MVGLLILLSGCSSLPEPKHTWHHFPKEAFLDKPKRPYKVIGVVKSRVDYQTLDPNHDEAKLCNNYFNQAAKKLIEYAHEKGADAVIEVRSVVFLVNGKMETYRTPECSDDGAEGQALAQGTAVKWE